MAFKNYSTKDVIEYWPSFLHDNPELKIRGCQTSFKSRADNYVNL